MYTLFRSTIVYLSYLLDQHEKQLAESFYEKKGYDPRYYVVSDDQSQVPYRYYGNTEELSEIEILIDEELRFLPEVSEIVGAIVNSKKNKMIIRFSIPKCKLRD